jgi:hypothetical protein
MNKKTLNKLVNLGKYQKLYKDSIEYYISNYSLGPITWKDAKKYKPFNLDEFDYFISSFDIKDTNYHWSSSKTSKTEA